MLNPVPSAYVASFNHPTNKQCSSLFVTKDYANLINYIDGKIFCNPHEEKSYVELKPNMFSTISAVEETHDEQNIFFENIERHFVHPNMKKHLDKQVLMYCNFKTDIDILGGSFLMDKNLFQKVRFEVFYTGKLSEYFVDTKSKFAVEHYLDKNKMEKLKNREKDILIENYKDFDVPYSCIKTHDILVSNYGVYGLAEDQSFEEKLLVFYGEKDFFTQDVIGFFEKKTELGI